MVGDPRSGYRATRTNGVGDTTAYVPDALGRVLEELLQNGETAAYGWDEHDNLVSVTPPGQPEHTQTFTGVNLMDGYAPPVLPDVPVPATLYTWTVDRELESTTRPDGLQLLRTYDAAGKPTTLTTPGGALINTFFGLTPCGGCAPGRLASVADPGGVTLSFAFDGRLQTREEWSGARLRGSACSISSVPRPP